MLTTKCSGGCFHCPFSDPEIPERHLPLDVAAQLCLQSKAPLTVLSGGEPFEYDALSDLLKILAQSRGAPFRIATGGFIPLGPWATQLQNCAGFVGVSFGTDVMISKSQNSLIQKIWINNINLLNSMAMPYSLTLTVTQLPIQKSLPGLTSLLSLQNVRPEFVYLRWSEHLYLGEGKELNTVPHGSLQALENQLREDFGCQVLLDIFPN